MFFNLVIILDSNVLKIVPILRAIFLQTFEKLHCFLSFYVLSKVAVLVAFHLIFHRISCLLKTSLY